MDNLLIKWRLLIMGCVTGMFFVLIGVAGYHSMGVQSAEIEELYQDHLQCVQKFTQIGQLIRDNRIQLLLAQQHDPHISYSKIHDHTVTQHTDAVAKNIDEINRLWKEFLALPGLTGDQKRLADAFSAARERYVNEGLIPVREAVLAGRFDDAAMITVKKINPLATATFSALDGLIKAENAEAAESYVKAQADTHRVRILSIVAILLAMGIGTLINLAVIRSVNRGTRALSEAATRMRECDFSRDVPLHTHDEMGQLAAAFNSMRVSVVELIGRVAQDATQVAANANQVCATSEQMVSAAEQAAMQAGSVATASEEMAATSGDIAQTCQMAADGSVQATQVAQTGAQVVDQTVSVMRRIADRVQESARAVESLGGRSDQIGDIVGTIEDIADQTNLLALNAAIEAARAGEQGRGFAVVADEVRALAERTTKATREIGVMIKTIQTETRGAVAAMNEGVQEVMSGTAEAARSGDALQEILGRIDAVSMQVSQIATAAEEQTATTSEISDNIQQITDVVEKTVRGAQESVAAANQLSVLAEGLQRVVGQFRLI